MNQRVNTASGSVLVATAVTLLLMALLGAMIASLLATGLQSSMEVSDSVLAYSAVESGISIAKQYVMTNPYWCATMPKTVSGVIGQARFQALITSNNFPMAMIVCTGECRNARWISSVTVTGAYTRAIVVYRDTSASIAQPRFRSYTNYRQLYIEEMANSVTNAPVWMKIVASPVTNEVILVTQNTNGLIHAQVGRINPAGISWSTPVLMNTGGSVSSAANRAFDVAYEELSGRAIVAYSDNTSTPKYRIWNGSSFSSEGSIDVGATTAIRWIRMVSRPGSNNIILLARWRPGNNYSSAIIWNGSSWGNQTGLENNTDSVIDYECQDAGYATNGNAIVIYVNGGTQAARRRPKYKTWNGSNWSVENTMAQIGAQPYWFRIEYSRDGSYAYGLFLDGNAYLYGSLWQSGWGTYDNIGILAAYTTRPFDVAWNSQSNTVMAVYGLSGQTNHSYMIRTPPGIALYNNNVIPVGAAGRWSVLRADPFRPDFIYVSLDSAADVNVFLWDGEQNQWRSLGEVETLSNVNYNSIDVAFRRDMR
jgi:hypothetical protein